MMVEDKLVACDGMGLGTGRFVGMFYTDDVLVGLWDPEWLQVSLNVLIGILRWYRLVANIAKSKSMMCHPGEICYGLSEEAVSQRVTGGGNVQGEA